MNRLRPGPAAAVILLLAGVTSSPSARAADDRTEAAALFAEAGRLIEAGQTSAACAKYEESLRLYDGMSTRYFLADCDERVGKIASAWGLFLEVAAKARALGDEAKEAKARERAAAVRDRVSHVLVVVEGTRGAAFEVRRDGGALGRAEWGQALPIDPGEHLVEASEPAKRSWSARVVVPAGGQISTVVVPLLQDDSASGPLPLAAARPAESASAGRDRQRVAGVVLGGAGLVGLGTAIALGFAAKSRFDEASADCNGDRCTQPGVDIRADAVARAGVATVVFGVGAAALVGGGVLWFTAPRAPRSQSGAVRFGPALGGVVVQGEF
jgi:hypothetical protein